MQYHQFRAMSTDIVLAGEGTPEAVAEGFRQAEAYVHASEARFTRFTETSELTQLNRSAGSWFTVSEEMFEIISLATRLYRQTRGLFDPAILESLEAAGYDRSIEEVRAHYAEAIPSYSLPVVQPAQVGSDVSLKSLPARPGLYHFADVRLEPAYNSRGGKIWMPPGMRIDLGGIGNKAPGGLPWKIRAIPIITWRF